MPNEKTDSLGFSTENPDMQRDMAAKGGPTTTLGKANDKHVAPTPASSDTQTEMTAESNDDKSNSKESNTANSGTMDGDSNATDDGSVYITNKKDHTLRKEDDFSFKQNDSSSSK